MNNEQFEQLIDILGKIGNQFVEIAPAEFVNVAQIEFIYGDESLTLKMVNGSEHNVMSSYTERVKDLLNL